MDLILVDDKNKTVHVQLPVTESQLISVGPPTITPGDSWIDTGLLVVLAKYGMEEMDSLKINDAQLRAQLEYWRDTYGGGKPGGGGK